MKFSTILLTFLAGAVAANPIPLSDIETRQDLGSPNIARTPISDIMVPRGAGSKEPVKGGKGTLPPSKKSIRSPGDEKVKGGKGKLPPSKKSIRSPGDEKVKGGKGTRLPPSKE